MNQLWCYVWSSSLSFLNLVILTPHSTNKKTNAYVIIVNNVEIMNWTNMKHHLHSLATTTTNHTIQKLASQLTYTLTRHHSQSLHTFKTINLHTDDHQNQRNNAHVGKQHTKNGIWTFQIRQLSFLEVGLAWKVWDSSLLLSEWIFNYSYLFK